MIGRRCGDHDRETAAPDREAPLPYFNGEPFQTPPVWPLTFELLMKDLDIRKQKLSIRSVTAGKTQRVKSDNCRLLSRQTG